MMGKKVGIYISGLGESINKENVEKYAQRIKNELNYSSDGLEFKTKVEKKKFIEDKETTSVTIYSGDETNPNVAYKIYDFSYNSFLTEDFKNKNILVKNMILLWLVLKKSPLLIARLFKFDSFNRPYLTFYAFSLFFIISLAIIFLIPASIDLATQLSFTGELVRFLKLIKLEFIINFFEIINFKEIVKVLVPFTTLILLITPESKVILTSMATEFASVDRYLDNGEKSQLILGNLDLLIEYIVEEEQQPKIHLHCYSFGSLIAMDLLFPLGSIPSKNVKKYIELLITTGNPLEFVNAYYPNYYKLRSLEKDQHFKWFNIYSITDALATNFRKKADVGNAEFGLSGIDLLPVNLNYEVAPNAKKSFFNFLTMHGIRIHKSYWDTTPNGQSCMRLIIDRMQSDNFLN